MTVSVDWDNKPQTNQPITTVPQSYHVNGKEFASNERYNIFYHGELPQILPILLEKTLFF